jgi:hypothetical protein
MWRKPDDGWLAAFEAETHNMWAVGHLCAALLLFET